MNKDPLQITTDLIINLNLISEREEFNINSFKEMRNIKSHWITIERYLKLFKMVQKYCPNFNLEDSNFTVLESKLQRKLNEKEKFILYLFNHGALSEENAVDVSEDLKAEEEVMESKGYLFNVSGNGKYYLNDAGIDLHRSILHRVSDIIINKKEIKPELERSDINFDLDLSYEATYDVYKEMDYYSAIPDSTEKNTEENYILV